jgi:MFS transporter, DHA2 family, multidrug resistance protein
MRNIGSSIGISVVIFLLNRNTQIVHSGLVEHVTPFSDLARHPAIAPLWNPGTVQGLAALDAEMTRQASAIAYVNDFKLMMIMTLASILLLPLLKRPPRHTGAAEPVAVD